MQPSKESHQVTKRVLTLSVLFRSSDPLLPIVKTKENIAAVRVVAQKPAKQGSMVGTFF